MRVELIHQFKELVLIHGLYGEAHTVLLAHGGEDGDFKFSGRLSETQYIYAGGTHSEKRGCGGAVGCPAARKSKGVAPVFVVHRMSGKGAKMKKLLLTLFAVLTLHSAWAGPEDDASAARQRGDYAAVIKIVRGPASKGEAWAQAWVGDAYFKGEGVSQDYAEAFKWYGLAARQGDALAQFNVGVMYKDGLGVAQDHVQAVKWYHLAAQQKNIKAQSDLGLMYATGQGVAKNYAEAIKWFRLVAQQGDATAQNNLGSMYGEGKGVAQDYFEAVKWFRLAAQQGFAPAQYSLGRAYVYGDGVVRDYVKAHSWFNLGAASGYENAISSRDILAKLMTPQQVAVAQKMARDCKARQLNGCD